VACLQGFVNEDQPQPRPVDETGAELPGPTCFPVWLHLGALELLELHHSESRLSAYFIYTCLPSPVALKHGGDILTLIQVDDVRFLWISSKKAFRLDTLIYFQVKELDDDQHGRRVEDELT
jgi:hypothetical protein